jgi:hypothetical protein
MDQWPKRDEHKSQAMIEKSRAHVTENDRVHDIALGLKRLDQRMLSTAPVCSGHAEMPLFKVIACNTFAFVDK